jgi:hypothetical protein
MKKIFKISVIVILTSLFSACVDENKDSTKPSTTETSLKKETYNYFVDGISYPVVMEQLSDGTSKPISEIHANLTKVLAFPTSRLLKDPFHRNTYFVFESEKESLDKHNEILAQLREYEKKTIGNTPNLRTDCINGYVEVFEHKDYNSIFSGYCIYNLVTDGGYSSMGVYNDKMSSYQVWKNTCGPRSDGKRYVIRFYEDSNYGGRALTAYSYFVDGALEPVPGDFQISWEDADMGNTLRVGGISKKYWGDCVSSYKWNLE